MKLKIKNLGAVKEIILDLSKPLSVFCGQNGTGKTWVAYVVYFLARYRNFTRSLGSSSFLFMKSEEGEEESIELNIDELWQYQQQTLKELKNRLWRMFSLEQNKQNIYFDETEIDIAESFETFRERILSLELEWTEGGIFLTKKADSLSIEVKLKNVQMAIRTFSFVYDNLILFPLNNTIIFPVERSAAFSFGRELTTEKKQWEFARKNPEKFSTENITTVYPAPVEDMIDFASDLTQIQKIKGEYYDFALVIEKILLKGSVSVDEQGTAKFSPTQSKKTKLSVHQSSSIVKSLLPLVLYLKHRARKGDLIIIDEPELNLHPANQIILVRVFARLIKAGLRLLISTHSDYIIREINNLIMIADGSDDVREVAQEKGYELDKGELISAKDVGVYVFKYPQEGSRKAEVTELQAGKSGFAVSILDDTIDLQNEISADLYYALKHGKPEK